MKNNLLSVCVGGGLWLAVAAACQPAQKAGHEGHTSSSEMPTAVADLEKQVMAVHDSIMPKMSDLMKLKKQVNERLAMFETQKPSAGLTKEKEQALALVTSLTNADKAMMDWMHQYNHDTLAKLPEAQATEYLNGQLTSARAMSVQVRKSLADANAYLK